MKKRIIFSMYIDIPEDKLDETGYSRSAAGNRHRTPRAAETKDKLKAFKNHLMWTQKAYADQCDADYMLFVTDKMWLDYYIKCRQYHDKIPMYHILNYYKHHLMYVLADEYDEVFYCDIDIIPVTKENIFEVHDMSYFWSKNNNELAEYGKNCDLTEYLSCDRNPATKYWNAYALLLQEGYEPECDVINTGTMIAGKQVIKEVNWPNELPVLIEKLKYLQEDTTTMFPDALHSRFAFDNETMFSYLIKAKGFKYASLTDEWHGRLPDNGINPDHKIIHAINKKFEFIWPDAYSEYDGRSFDETRPY